MPLFVESELQRATNLNIIGKFGASLFQGHRLTIRQIVRPSIPALKLLPRPERVKEDEVVQPPSILFAEAL
jgi:hypothetical protein